MKARNILCVLAILLQLSAVEATAEGLPYDPLAVATGVVPETIALTVKDAARNRDIPVRIYLSVEKTPAPVVLFSHGLGGSREGNAFMGNHWALRGYAAVFLQHSGSDTSVWKDQPAGQRMKAMKDAAGGENFILRVKDVPAVLDQLAAWDKEAGHSLSGRLDMARIGMSGHSFGAVTTQAVSGQEFARGKWSFTDSRSKAAVAFSPSCPARENNLDQVFGKVEIPWMLMTGTKDNSIIVDTDAKSRLKVFPALPPGGKYELVLHRAEHSAFTDRALPGDTEKRNPNHHRSILALSTAFWDTYLRDSESARVWLEGDGPGSVLEKDDIWQKK